MRVIGIDPGTATTGFSIIEKQKNSYKLLDYGCIITKAHTPLPERLEIISKSLDELVSHWKPNHAAIEEIFFSKNVKTAISVAQARGVIMHHLFSNGLSINEYNPLTVKQTICGHGKAEKFEMQKMIQLTFNLPQIPKPDDAADAIAIGYCHASQPLPELIYS